MTISAATTGKEFITTIKMIIAHGQRVSLQIRLLVVGIELGAPDNQTKQQHKVCNGTL